MATLDAVGSFARHPILRVLDAGLCPLRSFASVADRDKAYWLLVQYCAPRVTLPLPAGSAIYTCIMNRPRGTLRGRASGYTYADTDKYLKLYILYMRHMIRERSPAFIMNKLLNIL